MLLMANNPDIQARVQSELDQVCGSRAPTMDDKNALPYTEATILEIMRCKTPIPLAVPHRTTKDVTLQGYNIPRGTIIIPHQQMVHENEKEFPKPREFNPERFLKNGKFEPHPHVIPFGIGKRKCLGEALARMSVFVFFTRILQKFHIKPAHGIEKLDEEMLTGGVNHPKPFEIILEYRQW